MLNRNLKKSFLKTQHNSVLTNENNFKRRNTGSLY